MVTCETHYQCERGLMSSMEWSDYLGTENPTNVHIYFHFQQICNNNKIRIHFVCTILAQ